MGVGVDVCTGDREVARKFHYVTSSFLPRETRHSPKDPTGPNDCLCQQEVVLQGLSQSTRGSMSHHLIPTPQGSLWKVGPKPKHETNEIFL